MELSEFEQGFRLLRGAYGDRVFPAERETLLFRRYQNAPNGLFKQAVEVVVLHMMQPSHVLSFLDGELRHSSRGPLGAEYKCEACRDDGYGWIGDTIIACTCEKGRHTGPAELAKHQQDYDRGARFFQSRKRIDPFPQLPYDPKERQGA